MVLSFVIVIFFTSLRPGISFVYERDINLKITEEYIYYHRPHGISCSMMKLLVS